MIKLEDVNKYYNSNGVISTGLRHINLELNKNEIVAITGESGGGKSTLLNVITKMDTFDDGEIYYYGNETSYFNVNDMDQFRKNKIGFIFQNYNIIDSYTVLENVMLPLTLKGLTRKEAKEKATSLIEKVGLKNRIKNRGTKLSGGEKQRCVIARALASDCEILACDEPTGNLDSQTGIEIIKLIKEVAEDKLVLIVTHNYEQVKDIATRKIIVADGEITEDIKFKESVKDENKDLNLEYEGIPYKTTAIIAKNNLLFTPRKTLLTCIVFFCISLFALILYQSVYYTNNEGLDYSNQFIYKGDNKVLVYNNDQEPLDKEKLDKISGDKVYNLFYQTEYLQTTFILEGTTYEQSFSYGSSYEKVVTNLSLDVGRLPTSKEECVLLLPSYYSSSYCESFINSTSNIYIQNSYYTTKAQFKVVGVQLRSDIKDITFTCCERIENLFIAAPFLRLEGSVNHNSTSIQTIITTDESYLSIPEYGDYDFSKNLYSSKANIYGTETASLFEIRKVENANTAILYYSLDDKLNQDIVYEAAIYGDVDKIVKEVEDAGYRYVIPAKYDSRSKLDFYISNLTSYVTMVFASLSLVIVYIITYIILSKIYQSKKKDYTILRTLGVTKGDMKHIVNNEVMIQTCLISICSYLIVFTLGKTINTSIFRMFSDISLFSTILYFIVMVLFGYFIGRRFNYKLFKFSVNSTLKAEVAKND